MIKDMKNRDSVIRDGDLRLKVKRAVENCTAKTKSLILRLDLQKEILPLRTNNLQKINM